MRNRFVYLVILIASFASGAFAQAQDPHDLSGIWVRRGGYLSLSQTPPAFTAAGKKQFDANKPSYGPRAIPPALGNDPMGNCDPLGIPRLLILENNPGDFEFIQT